MMAIGLGKMIGFEIPKNFNRPYISKSITEFWRRWHITLLNFLREYVYFPLGGSRVSLFKNCRNIMIIFLLSGIWHGANWTFIFWGLYFGSIIVIEKLLQEKITKYIPVIFQRIITMILVLVGWVFFYSESLSSAFTRLQTMFTNLPTGFTETYYLLSPKTWLILAIAIICALFPENIKPLNLAKENVYVRSFAIFTLFFYAVFQLVAGSFNPFIYFRF